MHNLSVVFLKDPSKSSGYPYRAVVDHETQVAHPKERIYWEFFAGDTGIEYVEVDFGKPPTGPMFFDPADVAAAKGKLPKNMPISEFNFRAKVQNGKAVIYGTPPTSPSSREDKYWIRGYAMNGGVYKPVCELDPKIVTAVP